MKVHPLYHSGLTYVEPEIYGLAKYNLHYHELASIDNMLNYNFPLGESILVKDFCGENLTSLENFVTKVSEEEINTFLFFNKTTNLTRIQLSNSFYDRAFVNINSNNIKFANQGGMVSPDILKTFLIKEFNIVLSTRNSFQEFKFFIDLDINIYSIIIIGNQNIDIEVFKENLQNNIIPIENSQEKTINNTGTNEVYYYSNLRESLLNSEKLIFKYRGIISSSIAIKMKYSLTI